MKHFVTFLLCFFLISCSTKVDFTGSYTFYSSQEVFVKNPVPSKHSQWGVTKDTKVMAFAPINLKIAKNGDLYQGQLSMTVLQKQGFMGTEDDTSEISLELNSIIISKDTLNFILKAGGMLGSMTCKGFFIKANPNILALAEDAIDKHDCFEVNPAIIGNHNNMVYFKQLKEFPQSLVKSTLGKYRDCLSEKCTKSKDRFDKQHWQRTIDYVDSFCLKN